MKNGSIFSYVGTHAGIQQTRSKEVVGVGYWHTARNSFQREEKKEGT